MFEHYILNLSVGLAYAVFFFIIYAESGLLIGAIFPGDSLLFILGLATAQGHLNLWLLILLGSIAAIAGDSVGYSFGKKVGPVLFKKDRKRKFFNYEHLEKAHAFYEKYGVKTIVLARFTPFARTFAPILAGISEMSYTTFLTYNVIGGISWITLVLLLGHFLGTHIPNVDRYILPIVVLIVVVSVLPSLISALNHRRKQRG